MSRWANESHHPITGRQFAILTFISIYIMENGWSPSIREIAEAVGLDSTSSVMWQLKVLTRRGYIHRDPRRARSISVVGSVDAILASSKTPRATHRTPPGIGSTDWLRATRPPNESDKGRPQSGAAVFRVLDVWVEIQHSDPKIGADVTESDNSFAEDLASTLGEGAAAAGLEVGDGFTVDPETPGIIRTPPGGLYAMVFPDENRDLREGILLAVLSTAAPAVPGRFRDGWIERRTPGDDPVIAIYTRNGGGNRECYCEPPNLGVGDCTGCVGYRFEQHPLCIASPDDEFDSTYRTYYFIIPDVFKDRLNPLAQDHVDMGARWQTAIEAISAK